MSDEEEPALHQIPICALCLQGVGGECHTPGCVFWLHDGPTGDLAATLRRHSDGEIEGHWERITCQQREVLVDELGRSYSGFSDESGIGVWASRTDVERYIFTEWGYRDGSRPVLRDERWPNSDRPCEHHRFVPSLPETRKP